MQAKLNTETMAEKELWRELMQAWNDGNEASRFEIACQYTKKYPDNVWGWVALADILVKLARYEAAHRALSHAQKIAPGNIRRHIYVQWGHLYDESYELKKAEIWYRRALGCKETTTGLVFLGAVIAKQGRFAEAKACHRRAVRLATSPPDEAYYNLGLILRSERRYAKALECFHRAIEIDPNYTHAKEARNDVLKASKLKRQRGSHS